MFMCLKEKPNTEKCDFRDTYRDALRPLKQTENSGHSLRKIDIYSGSIFAVDITTIATLSIAMAAIELPWELYDQKKVFFVCMSTNQSLQ